MSRRWSRIVGPWRDDLPCPASLPGLLLTTTRARREGRPWDSGLQFVAVRGNAAVQYRRARIEAGPRGYRATMENPGLRRRSTRAAKGQEEAKAPSEPEKLSSRSREESSRDADRLVLRLQAAQVRSMLRLGRGGGGGNVCVCVWREEDERESELAMAFVAVALEREGGRKAMCCLA